MSLYTLRKHNPDIPAFVMTDCNTNDCLEGKRLDALARYAEVLSFDTPSEYNTEKQRSRFLKTSVRNRISGDFVFLDCDTLVCRPLSFEAFNDVVVGMVADLNGALSLSDKNTLRKCQDAGFSDFSGLPYFNSGFFFVKDDPLAYQLFDAWHLLWCESVLKGCASDQPALCEANRRLGFPIKAIDGSWNCQVHYQESCRFLQNAYVLHYFAADGSARRPLQEEELLKRVRAVGVDAVVDSILSGSTNALAAFFCQKTEMALRFLGTDLFSVFTEDARSFQLAERIAVILRKIKQTGHTLLKRK